MGSLELAAGSVFANRFEIERPTGSGGMGTVYRAIDRHRGEAVALKLLHAERAASGREEADRFAREAQLLSELHHPGIVTYVAHGQSSNGQRFLAMEWLDGHDLSERLARGPLPLQDCLRLLEQVADALCVAHQRGIIHRDLKPSNLFLIAGDIGRVKILDFGIARRVTTFRAEHSENAAQRQFSTMTKTGMVIGTPEYMAPEQARGNRDLTPAADLFSLGCVLYECLTGQPPFVADYIAAVLVRILFEEPMPVEQRRLGVPAPFSALLGRLLDKDPGQRVTDAAALRAELLRLGELPEPAQAVTLASPTLKVESFAEQDQSLISIVLAAPDEEELEHGATQPGPTLQSAGEDRQALMQSLVALGGIPDFLANGTLVVTLPPLGSAQDQVVQAARAALLIKERWPAAVVSMATGRGAIRGRTAVGEVVGLAARSLRSGRRPSHGMPSIGIRLDPLSAKLLEGRFRQTPQPDGALILLEERDVDDSRPLLGKPTPCVGREAELGSLESLLAGCIEECQARALLVTAPPGIGKSRLRHEFLRRVQKRREPVTVLVGRGDLLKAGAAYWMVGQAIRKLCEITSSDSPEMQRHRLRQRICRHVPAAAQEETFLFLGELCDVLFPEEEYPLLQAARRSPKLLPERMRQACLSWLAAECAAAPVLFVLDDLQWGDALTVSLLDEALQELREAPMFILALARPEVCSVFPSLWKRRRLVEISMKPLGKRACEKLITYALGGQLLDGAVAQIVAQSAGNALFLEELIRAAADNQSTKNTHTVIAMLQARIGHLDTEARRAVLAASIFGQTLWDGGVARVLELPESTSSLDCWLQCLLDAELIEAHSSSLIPAQKEYGFRHALVCDAAYELLTEHDKQLGHQRAAEYLASRIDRRNSTAILAYHYRQAGLFEEALRYYIQAGDLGTRNSLFEEALMQYEAATQVLEQLPSTPPFRRQRAGILIKKAQCSITAGTPEVNEQRLKLAQDILESLQKAGAEEKEDRLLLARIDYYTGRLHYYRAENALAISLFQRAILVGQEFQDQELHILSRLFLGLVLYQQGQIAGAIEMLGSLIHIVEQYLGKDIDSLRAHLYLAMALGLGGRGQDALRLIDYVRPWALEISNPHYLMVFYLNAGVAYCAATDWEASIRTCEQALKLAEKVSDSIFLYVALDVMAWGCNQMGSYATALEYRTRALELRHLHGSGSAEEVFRAIHADILLNLGQVTAAAEIAEQVATTARVTGAMIALSQAERVWGCALARLGRKGEDVDSHLRESLETASTVAYISGVIETRIAWARVCAARGDNADAKVHFTHARDLITSALLPNVRQRLLETINQGLQELGGHQETAS